MSTRLAGDARAEWRQHWPVVMAGCIAVASSTIHAYSPGLFIEPLQQAFGWSRAQIMAGPALAAISTVLLAPFMGLAIDRFGPKRIGLFGITALCCLTALLGLPGPNLWAWWGVWLAIALINPFIGPTTWTAGASGLFAAGRGTALAAILCGSGIGSIVVPLLAYQLIARLGWQLAYPAMAGSIAIIALPVIWLFFTSVRDQERSGRGALMMAAHARADGAVLRMMLSRRFILLLLASFLIAAVIVPIVVNIVPILTWLGLDRGEAAGVAAILGISSIVGRLIIGFLLDRVEGRFLAALSVLLPLASIALLMLLPGSIPAISAAVLILGFALGAEYDIVAYLVSRYFSVRHFGLFFGTVAGAVTLAGGGGPAVVSAVYDATGSYAPALLAAIPMCAVSALLFLSLGRYPQRNAADGDAEG